MNNSKISRSHNLKLAERGVWVSIAAYIFLSLLQLGVAQITNSASLLANGFNNVTDILGNIAIVIGLRIARIPSDNDHTYGHWKVESIASLISSFIMFFIGFEVLRQTIVGFIEGSSTEINPVGAAVALFSAFVMIGVYLYSSRLAKKTQSKALEASSKDNLSDALTSLGTTVAIVAAALHWIWLDRIMALVICGFILKTAYDMLHSHKVLTGYLTAVYLADGEEALHKAAGELGVDAKTVQEVLLQIQESENSAMESESALRYKELKDRMENGDRKGYEEGMRTYLKDLTDTYHKNTGY